MEENMTKPHEIQPEEEKSNATEQPLISPTTTAGSVGGGWSGWGFSPISIFRDLQKAAAVAAEEISRNGLKVIDSSAENFASGALSALGNAWKGGSSFVNKLTEMCCLAVSQLLIFAQSVISNAKKDQDNDTEEDLLNLDWPEDSVEKANIIRSKAQSMTGSMEAVSTSFITAEAYASAIKGAIADSDERIPKKLIHDKSKSFSENLGYRSDNSHG